MFLGCVEPTEPEFDFKEGLIFIDAFASTELGFSFVNIRRSKLERNSFSAEFVNNADVAFYNMISGEIVSLTLDGEEYKPPLDFSVGVGETWQLNVVMADGTRYTSLPETVLESVAINAINADYDPQLLFRENSEEFVPGHSISVSFQDPPDKENFYYWRFKSFETLELCGRCDNGVLRNEECVVIPSGIVTRPYYNYLCINDCWRIRRNENVKVFSDEFSDGLSVNSLAVADVLLYTKENILVELEQISLSSSAFKYFSVLNDIVDNNGSFNAPPPAALIGNLFNPNNEEEFVLGRFTATGTSSQSIFINREDINEDMIQQGFGLIFEEAPNDPFVEVITAVECSESRERTSLEPEGWISN